MPTISPYRYFSQKHPWTARILKALLIIIILLSLARASLPFAVTKFASDWLMSENVEANIGGIETSLLDGTFTIHDLVGINKTGKVFSLGRFAVAWQWKPLLDHHVIINHIEIDALNIDAILLDNGDMNIAGIFINAATDDIQAEKNVPAISTPWDVTVKNIGFSDISLCLQQLSRADHIILDYCGQLTKLEWMGSTAFTPSILLSDQGETLSATTNTPLYAQGALNIQDIILINNKTKRTLLKISAVDVNNITVETTSNIRIENINIEKLSAMQRVSSQVGEPQDNTSRGGVQASNGDTHVLSFDRLEITPISFSQLNKISLGTIVLTGTRAYLFINKEGQMDFVQWLPEKQDDVAIAEKKLSDTPGKTTAEPFHFSFDEFIFLSKQHLVFVDGRFEVPFYMDIHDVNLNLNHLDSHAPDQLSHVSLALAIGTHGRLKIDSDLNPLSDRPSIKGKGEISGLDLRMLDPLTKLSIGHSIKSGQLDAKLKLTVNKGIIDSNMDLSLHQFELKTLSKEEADKINNEFGFPLNSSLSLLRDRDNSIRLNIPVTGDIENPAFDPRDAIVKASSKAITTTVLHYYTPFGLIFAAESLFDMATALRFDPILFSAGASDLTPSHEIQLDNLAALIMERPGIHLSLCAISNNADKEELFTAPIDDAGNPQKPATQSELLSREDLARLKQLAELRSANIKHYMVSIKSVTSSRLIECAPEYKQDEISGVEISI